VERTRRIEEAVNAKTRYRRNADILAASVDDELVMMSMQAGNYYSIGGIGTLVWGLLAEPRSLDELVEAVMAAYDVGRDRCAADIDGFLQELIGLKLIEST